MPVYVTGQSPTLISFAVASRKAGEIPKGLRQPSCVFNAPHPGVKEIRERLGLTQSSFATLMGVSSRTLQNWEQGRRQPEGPAKALLRVVDREPQAVLHALHG